MATFIIHILFTGLVFGRRKYDLSYLPAMFTSQDIYKIMRFNFQLFTLENIDIDHWQKAFTESWVHVIEISLIIYFWT